MPSEHYTIPLLADHHSHPFLYAGLMDGIDLGSVSTREEANRRVRAVSERSNSGWTLAYGWHSGRYALSASDYDDLPPLAVINLSLHGIILNRAGRELMSETDPEVVEHLDDQSWLERNLRRVLTGFARIGATPDRLQRFFRHLLEKHGVYFVEEMLLVGEDEVRLFEAAGLSLRTRFWAPPDVYDRLPDDVRSSVHGIKLFTDGAIGTRTAAMHEPYRDTRENGLLLYEDVNLEEVARRYLGLGLPMAIHAIGDRAIDQVIDVMERVGPSPGRVRIEHAQLISLRSAERAKALGIHLCMQPNFSDDSLHFASRLPDGYVNLNNPFRMLIDRVGFVPGKDLFFGSDGMPHGVEEALRQSLFPSIAGQRVTLDEFVAGYCVTDRGKGHVEVEIDRGAGSVRTRVSIN